MHIGIVGKYTQLEDAYKSIVEALTHGGMANRTRVVAEWIDAEIFEREDPTPYLDNLHAIIVPGGFGERGTEGMIKAAQFAREKKVPYLGICLGMQMAVIEAARNLVGLTNAGSEEFDQDTTTKRFTPVVYHLKEWVQGNHTVTRKPGDAKGGISRVVLYSANPGVHSEQDSGSRPPVAVPKIETPPPVKQQPASTTHPAQPAAAKKAELAQNQHKPAVAPVSGSRSRGGSVN